MIKKLSNLIKIFPALFLIVFASFFIAEKTLAARTCPTTPNPQFGYTCPAGSWWSNMSAAGPSACQPEKTCPVDPTGGVYNLNCNNNTCELSCTSPYVNCAGVCQNYPYPSTTDPNCTSYNNCTNPRSCNGCAAGYTLVGGVCTGASLKLNFDSVLSDRLKNSTNVNPAITVLPTGFVGIGTNTPTTFLQMGDSGQTLNMGGGRIGGLDLTPLTPDEAVPLGYLQANYSSTSSSFWNGSLGGNIWNANTGNVGIGTNNPSAMLDINKFLTQGTSQNMISLKHDGSWGLRLVQNFSSSGNMQYDWVQKEAGVDKNVMTFQHGNVGIGTNNPVSKLTVVDSGLQPQTIRVLNSDTNTGFSIKPQNNGVQSIYADERLQFTSGFSDSYYISFATGADQNVRMRILGNGNVGIGTTDPISKLSLGGQYPDYRNRIALYEHSSGYFRGIGMIHPDSTYGVGIWAKGGTTFPTDANADFVVRDGGNVGIGTTNPNAKLKVVGNIHLKSPSDIYDYGFNINPGAYNVDSTFTAWQNSGAKVIFGGRNTGSGYITSQLSFEPGAGIIRLSTSPSPNSTDAIERMRIDKDGNIGIGTTTPTSRLSVIPDGGSTSDVVNIFGGAVGGLDLTPLNPDQAVPLGYLQANYLDKNTSGIGKFVGLTTGSYDGKNSVSGTGYEVANDLCDAEYDGSHVCASYEMLNTIVSKQVNFLPVDSSAWVFNGPPGYTWTANDCLGRNDNQGVNYGTVWVIPPTGGRGYGSLDFCNSVRKLACCK